MKGYLFLLSCLFASVMLSAQVSKTVTVTAGGLASQLTATEKNTVTDLTLTGTIDARDFKTMRDSMKVLSALDLSGSTIAAFNGNGGTYIYGTNYDYPVNCIPVDAFNIDEILNRGNFSLTSISFPANLRKIDDRAFCSCVGLKGDLIIPSGVDTIGYRSFMGSGFKGTLTIPASVTTIMGSAFDGCGFNGLLSLPDGVKVIEDQAFFSCSGFTGSLKIPNSVTTIGTQAFAYCNSIDGDITIPATTTDIGIGPFCCSRGTIKVNENNPIYSSIDGILFNKNKTKLIQCPVSKTETLTIPATVSDIADFAFYGCTNFTGSLTIPSTVEKIGRCAFYGCTGFTGALTIPSTIDSIYSYAFGSCKNLTSIYSKKETPIDLTNKSSVFSGVSKSMCTLYVPTGSKAAYQTADQWKDFTSIVEMEFTSVPSLNQKEQAKIFPSGNIVYVNLSEIASKAKISVYDLSGNLIVSKMTCSLQTEIPINEKGIYLVRLIEGNQVQTAKVLIK